jgi:hypothetical protein
MSHEKLVKRTLWVAQCNGCDAGSERTTSAKEWYCPGCRRWIPYKAVSWTGPEVGPPSEEHAR